MIYVSIYLIAIVLANLSVLYFGPSAVYVNAFLFIGLDLTSRDKLHEAWRGNNLFLKMFFLVISGSLLSYLLNSDVYQIAVASTIAFGLAAITDSIVYQLLSNRSKMIRINGSNIPSALVDSLVFPTIAFGSFSVLIVLGQFAAKVFGGFVWSLVIKQIERARE